MDQEDIKDLFDEKYEHRLGISFREWKNNGPQNETEAYARLQEIDDELKSSHDEWFEAEGDRKDELEEHRDKLKSEYDLLEEIYGLESQDKSW
jgi:hypothetical protein